MKRIVSMLLVTVMCCGLLVGCGGSGSSQTKEESKPAGEESTQEEGGQKEESVVMEDQGQINAAEQSQEETSYIEKSKNEIAKIIQDGGYDLSVTEDVEKKNQFYSFYITDKNANKGSVSFYQPEAEPIQKSFSVDIYGSEDNDFVKSLAKIIVAFCSKNTESDFVENEVRNMVASMSESVRSSVCLYGDYHVYLEKRDASSVLTTDSYEIRAKHVDEVNKPVVKDEYKVFSCEEMLADLNKGEKAVVEGNVVSYTLNQGEFYVENDKGEKIVVHYNFDAFMTDFEIGKKYSFYGEIAGTFDDTPHFRVDYYEE